MSPFVTGIYVMNSTYFCFSIEDEFIVTRSCNNQSLFFFLKKAIFGTAASVLDADISCLNSPRTISMLLGALIAIFTCSPFTSEIMISTSSPIQIVSPAFRVYTSIYSPLYTF